MKLLHFLFFSLTFLTLTHAQCDRTQDSLALVALYNSTDGPNWTNTWDLNQPMHTWFGIDLNGNGCVSCVDLDGNPECNNGINPDGSPLEGNNLNGQLPIQFFNLSQIEDIFLSRNSLNSVIEPQIANIATLERLDLGQNALSGNIPDEIGDLSELIYLSLSSNDLEGTIPSSLGQLSKLVVLSLSVNNLTGNIPASIGMCSNLSTLDLGINDLAGNIPPELGDLGLLRRLVLHNNELLGEIPLTFSGLQNIEHISLYDNNLDGEIPLLLGSLKKIRILSLGANLFSGSIPDTLTTLMDLRDLRLDMCQLSGDIPFGFGGLSSLSEFKLSNNMLSGCIPADFQSICDLGFAETFYSDGYNLTNNPCLPWLGDLQPFCNGEEQVGAPTDDGDDSNGTNDTLQEDCSCGSILDEICDNGIDDDGDGLVDCDDDDVSGLICCQTDLCNDAVDVDGDNIGDACDQDDDNDGILDATECPPVFLSTNTIDEWIAVTGGDEVDVQIGDVFIAEQHYIAANGNQYDLRFELLDKYSSDTIADYRAKIRTSSGGQIGICLDGGIPAQNDHIVYDLSWVESGSVNTGNLSGIPASFDWARIFIRDIDNNSSFFINTDGDTIYIDPNFTDVGGFANTIYNFEAGDLLQSYVLPNGQEVFGVSEPSLDLSNCNGCTISGEMMPFNNASLVHGVVGTRQGSTNRLAQWNFLLGDCRDTDGDGIPDYRDPDSDDDGCTDAVEGGADFSNADTENGFLTGDIDSITGIPLIAENGQFLGTSLLSGIQDPDCFDIEICDNGIDDDGDGDIDCDDSDLSNTCCCLEASAFDIQDIEQCGGNVALNGSNDFTNYQWTDLGTGQLLFTSSSAIFSTSGTYQVSVLDSCDNIIIDSFDINLLQQYELFEDYEFCEGDSILINGEIFDQGGMYDQFFTTSDGCDSIIRIDVLEIPIVETSESYTIFEGENITINTETYNAEGLYTQVLTGQNGCDSILSISIEVLPFGDPEVLVYYDFGNCNPGTSFSEFGPSYPNTLLCGDVTGYLPNGNAHSCTPGVDAGEAICISASTECDVDFNSINKVEFSFGVNPEQGAAIVIPSISFYEKAPEQFEWQNGITGQNNYPTRYAIRVLKDNVEIYSNNSIITNREWTAQTFDFSGVSEFVFSSSSALKIQLFPYCPLGLPTTVSAWDIDEFTVSGYCSSAMRSVQGKIQNISNSDVISQIEVELNIDGNITESLTDDEGVFAFNNFEWETYANLKAHSNREPLNGVSTIDLILMQKHLLGIEPFDSPYKMIAADINSSASVSAIDLVELRKLILGIHSEFPENNSWRFIDAKQSLTIDNPWIFTETIKLSPLSSDMMNENFVGVKVGDVNNSVVANATGVTSENRSNGALTLEVMDKAVVAGETVKVDFMSSDYTDVYGYQFTMNFNGMNVSGITAGANNVTEANIAVTGKTMTMSYHNNVSANVSADDVLFTLEMTATTSGNLSDMITVGSSITRAEAYVGEGLEVVNVDLGIRTEGAVSIVEGYELYQNEPNPFKGMTQIGFSVPQATTATVTVYDVTGKVVKNLTIDAVKGYNTVQLTRNDLGASAGVLYYQLESGDFTAVKRMIVVE